MPQTRRQKLVLAVVLLLTAASLVALVMLTSRHREDRDRAQREYRAAALDAVHRAASRIEAELIKVKAVDQLIAELNAGELTEERVIKRRFKALMEANPAVGSVVLAYPPATAPEFFPQDPETEVHLVVGREEGIDFELARYTRAQAADDRRGDITAWYRRPLEQGRGVWNDEPYYSPLSKRWWSGGYGAPFSYTSRGVEVQGVVYADLSLERIQLEVYSAISEAMKEFPLEASYAFIISKSGHFLSHPDASFVERQKTLADFEPRLATVEALSELQIEDPEAARPVRLLARHEDLRSGQESLVFFSELAESGWWLAIALDKAEAFRDGAIANRLHSDRLLQTCALLAFLVAATALAVRVHLSDEWRLWAVSLSVTMCALGGIGLLWFLHLGADPDQNLQDIVVLNGATVQKVRLQHRAVENAQLIVVPTGVYVQSVEFSSANNVTVTGYVWQKYDKAMPRWVIPQDDEAGFILPESEETEITRAYESRDSEGVPTLIGWYFKAVLRQEFDYSHYPFDSEVVWVRLWHSMLGEGVALAPDIVSYDTLDPSEVPGVETQEQGFVLEGWRVSRSFFSYRLNSYSTDFGLGGEHASRHGFPELYFNVGLDRVFLNPFIGNFIPLVVVAFLLFGVLWTVRLEPETSEVMGFNSSAVLGFCAALFFVVIVAHTSLRDSLAAQRIVYLEYFYFVLYVAILGVAINSVHIASPTAARWIRHGDNLPARLLYWPVVTVSLLWITMVAFG